LVESNLGYKETNKSITIILAILMKRELYLITGATGNIGQRVAKSLLGNGQRVAVIGRDAKRLKPLADEGAELLIGSIDDKNFLSQAFQSAKAIFALIPPSHTAPNLAAYQNAIGEAQASAVMAANVSHVVTISSVGAHLAEGTGSILGLHENEQRFNRLPEVNVVHLRTGYFMENFFYSIGMIKKHGFHGSAIAPEVPISMIATQDVAAVASQLLLELQFTDKSTRELLGPCELTMLEATKVLAEAIGKPDLRYLQFSYREARQAMLRGGMSESVVDAVLEMNRACNEGLLKPEKGRLPESTTPTTIEAFAKEFASAYREDRPALLL
jgi:uncharacterized protein YbjT (DUF2867 family)